MPRKTTDQQRLELLETVVVDMNKRMTRLEKIGYAAVGLLAGYGALDVSKLLGLVGN